MRMCFLIMVVLLCFSLNAVFSASLDDTTLENQITKSGDSNSAILAINKINTAESTKLKINNENTSLKSQSETSKTTTSQVATSKTTTSQVATSKTATSNNTTSKKTNNTKNCINSNSIIKKSSSIRTFVETNGEIPASIEIDNKTLKDQQYVYMACQVLVNTSSKKLEIKKVNEITNSKYNPKSGQLSKSEYLKLAKNFVSFVNKNGRSPNTISSTKGKIPYSQFAFTISKGLDYYNKNKRLPNYITLENISKYSKNKVKVSSILTQASTVKKYIETNGKLPQSVTVENKKYTSPEFLYLMSKSLEIVNNNKNISQLKVKNMSVKNPTNQSIKAVKGSLSTKEYVNLSKNTAKAIEKNKRPSNWVTQSKLKIPYGEIFYTLSVCLDYYKKNKKLPSSVSLKDIQSFKKSNSTKTTSSSTKTNSSSTSAGINISQTPVTEVNKFVMNVLKNKTSEIDNKINDIFSSIDNEINNALSVVNSKLNGLTNVLSSLNTASAAKNVLGSAQTSVTSKVAATNKTSTSKTTTTNKTSTTKTTTTNKTSTVAKVITSIIKNVSKYNETLIKLIPNCILNSKYNGESLKKYLVSSQSCSITNTLIKNLAKKLTSKCSNNLQKANKIFNWVRDNVKYKNYPNTQKGAVKTLEKKVANCVDQAHLVVALSRASGIPARYVHGKKCKFSSGIVTGHVWSEILIENTWVASDTTSSKNSLGKIKNWDIKNFKLVGKYSSLSF